jgi:lipopolysaccharide/colanic/teichoic acid biosynthesis glycosyltransferase/multisubunit Na+/H+ antiporter MnhF subunit
MADYKSLHGPKTSHPRNRARLVDAMKHDQVRAASASILVRKRVQFAGALLFGSLMPYAIRVFLSPDLFDEPATVNALSANAVAVVIAFWTRLSIETYPGIRRSLVILPAALTGHGLVLVWFVLTRFAYDRLGLAGGFVLHVAWLYVLYIFAERRLVRRIAVVPFGAARNIVKIHGVDWHVLERPSLHDTRSCNGIVADFGADLPDEWEAFLADAALAGRIVYQVKQLSESLTGRVELEQLSENSFGSLVPAQGYFYLKSVADFVFALLVLPVVLPLTALIALAIRIDSPGPIFFRQKRIGHAGKAIIIYKFRTMHRVEAEDERTAAMTQHKDGRITKVGHFLRKIRIDELPQILNVLKWEMSWIGPRPEAQVLSVWYTDEIPFYRYRHVVKPGISGWAQVNQGHVAELGEVHAKLHYDFYYIKYFSPWLDILIFFRTIKTILTGFGSR